MLDGRLEEDTRICVKKETCGDPLESTPYALEIIKKLQSSSILSKSKLVNIESSDQDWLVASSRRYNTCHIVPGAGSKRR